MLKLSPCDKVAGLTPQAGSTELTSILGGSPLTAQLISPPLSSSCSLFFVETAAE